MQTYKISRLQEVVFDPKAKTWSLKPASRNFHSNFNPILPTLTFFKPKNYQTPAAPNSTYQRNVDTNPNKPNRLDRRLTTTEMDKKEPKAVLVL